YRLGQRCPSVRGPLHRGQVAIGSVEIVSRLSWLVHLSTYHSREISMRSDRVGSTVLLAGGVFLVLGGMSSAFGFSASGIVAGLAVRTALLYAGGVWFGEAPHPDPSIVVFTPALTVAAGALSGRRVADLFEDGMRDDIEIACRDALDGRPSRFSIGRGSSRRA